MTDESNTGSWSENPHGKDRRKAGCAGTLPEMGRRPGSGVGGFWTGPDTQLVMPRRLCRWMVITAARHGPWLSATKLHLNVVRTVTFMLRNFNQNKINSKHWQQEEKMDIETVSSVFALPPKHH